MPATRERLSIADLHRIRASVRDSAREVEEMHLAHLDGLDAGPGAMRAPRRLQRDRLLGYVSREAGDYDWFYGLSRAEQKRLRERWFSDSPTAQSPDEVAEKIDLRDWLAHTRRADAARALATGRHVNADRYGGLNPNSLIAGSPYDVRALWGEDRSALRHVQKAHAAEHRRRGPDDEPTRYYADDGAPVAFRTRPDGTVYPIREGPAPASRPYDPFLDEPF